MSVFFPYSPSVIATYFASLFNLSLSSLTDYESLVITLLSNIYFFLYWFIIVYICLKIFNRIWERMF